jgi:hypothetical protein
MVMSRKQKLYKKYRKQGYDGYNAARLARYPVDVANKHATKEDVMADLIVQNGLTPNDVAKQIIEGCKANDMMVDKHGEEHYKPNWGARKDYHKMVLEMRGDIGKNAKGDDSNIQGLVIIRADGKKLEAEKVETIDVVIDNTDVKPVRQVTPLSVNG